MAEGVGFEPTKSFHSCRFSRPVQSTTLPPLLKNSFWYLAGFQPALAGFGSGSMPSGLRPGLRPPLFRSRRRVKTGAINHSATPPDKSTSRPSACACRFWLGLHALGASPWPAARKNTVNPILAPDLNLRPANEDKLSPRPHAVMARLTSWTL